MKIIYANPDGTVSVTTDASAIPPDAVSPKLITDADLPDRSLRDAWEYAGGAITISIPKAQEITKRRLRLERQALFKANDLAIQNALLDNDVAAKTAATKERDRLRDVTKLVDATVDVAAMVALSAAAQTSADAQVTESAVR